MDFNDRRIGNSPVPDLSNQAARYRKLWGVGAPDSDYARSAINPARSQEISSAYEALPEYDKSAEPAYKQMGEEVGRQFDFMTKPRAKGGIGLEVNVTKADPYGWPSGGAPKPGEEPDYSKWDYAKVMPQMRDDVVNNNRMNVYDSASTGGHPYFSDDQNNMFRAVHDTFGHLASGRGIDFNGEEAAFQKHAAMFSPLARGALATETRGQNSYLRAHGDFPQQKLGILPEQFHAPRNLNGVQFSDIKLGRQKNTEQGL